METEQIIIKVKGMTCGHCEARVEKAVKKIPGVRNAKADRNAEILSVECEPHVVTAQQLAATVQDTGYTASV